MRSARYGTGLYRAGLAVAVVAFAGYFAMIALGDLFPLEQFGAEFVTAAQTSIVQRVDPVSPAGRAGLLAGDRIVAVGGRPVRNALDWASVFARVETGHTVPIVVQRAGQPQELSAVFYRRPDTPWGNRQGLFLILARAAQLLTLIFAIAIGLRAKGPSAVLGFWLLATISIYSVGLPPRMAVVWRGLPVPLQVLFFLPSVSKVLIGLILFAFFCTLLKVPLWGKRSIVVAAPFVAFAIWDAIFLVSLLYRPGMLPRLTAFLPAIIIVNFAYLVAALVVIGMHYRTLDDPSDRRRLRWIVAGSVLGCAAGAPTIAGLWLGVGTDPTLIYHSPFSLQLVYTAFLVMPASFWWAIARGELFDLRFVVRRGLQYVFARRGLLVITPLVIVLLVVEAAFHDNEPFRETLRTHAWLYFGAAAGLIVFRRRRAFWLDLLDRRLFRERYDACQSLREVVAQIRTSSDVKTAAECAVTQIRAALHPEWVAVCACRSSDTTLAVVAGDATIVNWPCHTRLMDELRAHGKPLDVSMKPGSWVFGHLRDDEIQLLERGSVRLIVPATVDMTGPALIFALGAKRSGEPYSQEDKNLVQAIAESVGHLATTMSHDVDGVGSNRAAASWDTRLWSLADAVARGSHVDWTKESSEVVADERRQALLELQALERLMQVHGAPSDTSDAGTESARALRQWGYFELREQIGAGRFGSVYRAWDPKLERDIAIKLLTVAGVDRAPYLREARHLARVRHPNVVHVYGADEFDDIPGFWMELVAGRTLSEELGARGAFSVEEVSSIGSVLCRALAAVHRAGLVHQDVKAQNVMREHDGRLVLMDLGAGTSSETRPASGTPRYMAPELFHGGAASPRSDIYSLGALLFFLSTGEFPTDGRTYEELAEQHGRGQTRSLRDLRPNLPSAFLAALDRVLSANPLGRFATAEEFGASLLVEVS